MKLNITCEELEQGYCLRRIGEKKRFEWAMIAQNKSPVALKTPLPMGGKTYRVAVVTLMEGKPDGKFSISFKPVWGRLYRGCHMRSSDIRLLVGEFECGKVQVDSNGVKSSSFTTNGAGVGREAEEEAEQLLATLISEKNKPAVVRQLEAYISKKFA